VRAGYAPDPAPRAALDELARQARTLEGLPAEHLPGMGESVSNTTARKGLDEAMHVSPAEIALVRNATEALDTVLLGLPMRAGDEVVCSPHDYYAMLERRRGCAIRSAPGIRGLRVSPNVSTRPAELHRFVAALAAEARA
jgi:selenocysteine lyase/cysteine desulfurase